ncbi:DUF6338 family protein [Streptomyces albus]|uniref:DUF6338 family protein n=1 Tax=Streptomyces albus TaxID=1888 RepID=UPI0004C9B019|nr:DUF6338 family protein [Streptomyces albus]
MQTPSSVQQFVLLVFLVLPGVTYQYLRERWRGPVPGERQLGERVLRAVTASVTLNALYAATLGPYLVDAFRPDGGGSPYTVLAEHPRAAGLWSLLLFLGVPAAAAAAVSLWQRHRATAVHRSAPTAWDHLFGHARDRGPCFIRARLKDGAWVGGWYDSRSYASGYPHGSDLFLQWAYEMGADGSFGPPVTGTAGLYLRVENIDVLELVEAP